MYVVLDNDPPSAIGNPTDRGVDRGPGEDSQDLEAQVELLQGQLEQERQRNAGLVDELKAAQIMTAQERRGPWWRFW